MGFWVISWPPKVQDCGFVAKPKQRNGRQYLFMCGPLAISDISGTCDNTASKTLALYGWPDLIQSAHWRKLIPSDIDVIFRFQYFHSPRGDFLSDTKTYLSVGNTDLFIDSALRWIKIMRARTRHHSPGGEALMWRFCHAVLAQYF